MDKQITYAEAGVDIEEGAAAVDAIKDAVHSTYRPEVIGDIGGFGGLFSAAAFKEMEDPIMISGTDGVGTKLKLAQLLDKHDTVGIDLVAMCVNDILACGAEPLFFLDYIAIGKLRREHVANVVGGIAEGCRQAGCALIGGEMAEHPGVMDPVDNVREGDVLVGLKSSGFHSNGYSLVRRVLVEGKSAEELSAPCDELGGRPLGEALLAPTRIYVKPVLGCLRALPGAVHALAHITGGGITENLNRALPATLDAVVEPDAWEVPAVIELGCKAAGLSDEEARKTFNMGIGMILLVDPAQVDAVLDNLSAAGEDPVIVGKTVPGTGIVQYA